MLTTFFCCGVFFVLLFSHFSCFDVFALSLSSLLCHYNHRLQIKRKEEQQSHILVIEQEYRPFWRLIDLLFGDAHVTTMTLDNHQLM